MSAPPSRSACLPLFAHAPPDFAPDAPVTRADCLSGGINAARPCPWVSCDHHALLGLLSGSAGDALLADESDNSTLTALALMPASCVLDLADRGATLDEIAGLWGVTKEAVRHVEVNALGRMKLRGRLSPMLARLHAEMAEEPVRDVVVPTVHRCGPVGLTAVETARAERPVRVWRPEPQPEPAVVPAVVPPPDSPEPDPLPVEEPVQSAPEPTPSEPTAAPEPPTTDVIAQPAPITPTTPATPEEQPVSKPTKTTKQPKKTARKPARKQHAQRKPTARPAAGSVPIVVSELRALTESLATMFGGGR